MHLIIIKPVLYGDIAARLVGISAVVVAVSGLGAFFIAHAGLAWVRRQLVSVLYRLALSHKLLAVIFQNPDDRDGLLLFGALRDDPCGCCTNAVAKPAAGTYFYNWVLPARIL